MQRQLLVALLVVLSSLVYGQENITKVYLTNGEVKEGDGKINEKLGAVGPIVLKGGKYMKEIILKTKGGKEKIGVEQIKRVEFIIYRNE